MNTQASRIVVRLLVLIVAAVVCFATGRPVSLAQSITAPSQSAAKRLSRSERLRDWLDAVERHEPGIVDQSIGVFDSWRPDDFQYLAIDLNTLVLLIEDPGLRTFFYKSGSRSRQIVYNGSDLKTMLALAMTARNRVGEDTTMPPEQRLQKNRNRVLERAAIFHTDVALDALLGGRSNVRAPLGLQSFTLLLPDGRSQGMTVDVGHWELARSILDKVSPAPARHEFVRGWYIATAAYLEGLGQLVPAHFDRGLHWFPDDAELLFFAGCLHESLAETRIQEAMQSAAIPPDVKFDVSSRRAELRAAESLFRKAVKARPDLVEARIRLGRVLSLRGEHAEAETLLRPAVEDARDPLLAYLAHLFLASEVEARGDSGLARDLYAKAGALYPNAQSPRLALSALEARAGNDAGAFRAMSAVLALPGDQRIDPWWTYHQGQGRNAPLQLKAVYKSFLDEERR